jgi:hypothetical protein
LNYYYLFKTEKFEIETVVCSLSRMLLGKDAIYLGSRLAVS